MNRLLNIYFKLPHDRSLGIISKAFNRFTARIIKRVLDRTIPNYFLKTQKNYPTGVNQVARDKKVIVSFTSFPGRIEDVWIVVECLFRQSYKVDRIILWLDKDKFSMESLPKRLVSQINRGLEIRFIEDLRSHTKYFYALQEFKDYHVVTVDDDCYYPENTIENLVKINKDFPSAIASNRVHKMKFEGENLKPYSKWHHNYTPKHSISGKYLLTGVAGVLYPPNIFDELLFDKSVFLDKCKYADDVWLTLNAFRLNIKIASNNKLNKDLISISNSGNHRLLNFNSKKGGNDEQLMNLLDYFQFDSLQNLTY